MIRFPVSPEKSASLQRRMDKLGIREADIEESFIRSSGKGGQNVNKVATSVRLAHAVSGVEVKCSMHRTQGLNRYKARVILCERLEERAREEDSIESEEHRKKRKAKMDRARRARKKAAAKNAGRPRSENWQSEQWE